MLEVRNVSKSFFLETGIFLNKTSPRFACRNVNLRICSGEIVALVGESGSGKSTLAKIITGLEKPDEGAVFIDGKPLAEFSREALASLVGIVFQNPYASLNPRLRVRTMLGEVIRHRRKNPSPPPEEFRELASLLSVFSMDEKAAASGAGQLSGGQSQRVALARSFAMFPKYLILDEVTSSLDVSTAAAIISLLKRLNRKYRTSLLFITHDLVLAGLVAERIYVMKEGGIVEKGYTDDVFENPQTEYVKTLKAAII